MLNEKELPFLAEKGHIVSLVGGGGKTTLLYAMADHCARKGWQVLVTTTTHIRQPAACYAPDDTALTALWQAGHYAVIGIPAENGKLTLPQPQLLRRMAQTDAVFIEADGARSRRRTSRCCCPKAISFWRWQGFRRWIGPCGRSASATIPSVRSF